MSSIPVPVRLRPVTLKCSRVDIELSAGAREKLLRRVRHLDGAASLVASLDGRPTAPIELTAGEKGFLVVAITAWAEAAGRSRVPGELLRLQTTLLGDLYYPVEEAEPAAPTPVAEPVVEPPAAAPEPEPDPEVLARLAAMRGDLEHHLQALADLDEGGLGRARAALRRAVAELGAALDAEYGAKHP
jgi:hypothetical protein